MITRSACKYRNKVDGLYVDWSNLHSHLMLILKKRLYVYFMVLYFMSFIISKMDYKY